VHARLSAGLHATKFDRAALKTYGPGDFLYAPAKMPHFATVKGETVVQLHGEIGEAHNPEPHLIPRVLAAARDGTAVTVYGDNYETADGTCIRDYIHVTDIADAHVRAVEYLLSGGSSCALNLANARGYSVMEVIQVAQRVTGKAIRVETAPRRPGAPAVLIGSSDRTAALLEWIPKRSALELQITDAWNWMGHHSGHALPLDAAFQRGGD
jgi:UDP-glucose 4-epimerase